jgi:hypothetical protein
MTIERCECGNRLDWTEKSERMSRMCWECQQTCPEEFNERYLAALESYRETPEVYQ